MNQQLNKFKHIAVDIDGVLCIETVGWDYAVRTPNEEAIHICNTLYNSGKCITLFTSRYACDKEVTEQWLHVHGVKYHEIIFDKPAYDILVDDKTVISMKQLIRS